MLAEHHVVPVLLGAAGRDDDRRLAGLHRVARFFPGQLVDEDRVGRLRRRLAGRRRVHRRLESSAVRRRERPRRAAAATASATAPPAFGRCRRFGLLSRDRAGHQPFDLRERVVDLDLQERLAEFGRRLRLVVAADAVVLVVVAGQAVRGECASALTNSSSEVSRMFAWPPIWSAGMPTFSVTYLF